MPRKLAPALAALTAFAATASGVHAASAGQVCPPFERGKLTYRWETIGTGWTCASARAWVLKLSADRAPRTVTRNVPLRNGPRRLHCFADPFSSGGHATAGSCIAGSIAFPRSGFAWTGSR